jgi:hypothetical protein
MLSSKCPPCANGSPCHASNSAGPLVLGRLTVACTRAVVAHETFSPPRGSRLLRRHRARCRCLLAPSRHPLPGLPRHTSYRHAHSGYPAPGSRPNRRTRDCRTRARSTGPRSRRRTQRHRRGRHPVGAGTLDERIGRGKLEIHGPRASVRSALNGHEPRGSVHYSTRVESSRRHEHGGGHAHDTNHAVAASSSGEPGLWRHRHGTGAEVVREHDATERALLCVHSNVSGARGASKQASERSWGTPVVRL